MSPDGASERPILAVDVDGVISLFGFEGPPEDAPCNFRLIDGMAHCISAEAGDRLQRLLPHYELIWATGWEDRANEYLLHLLGLPELPVLHFGRSARFGSAHWKLTPIEEYAAGRPLAWIDDSLDDACRDWARERPEPTLLVATEPQVGLQEDHVELLLRWAADPGSAPPQPDDRVAPEPEEERVEAMSARVFEMASGKEPGKARPRRRQGLLRRWLH